MNAEFLASMSTGSVKRGRPRDPDRAVEDALLSAAKRAVGPLGNCDARSTEKMVTSDICQIDRRGKRVNKHDEIALESAKRFNPDAQLNEEIELEVTPKNFGRIASQNAKQALMQAIRRAEKALIYSEFHDRIGDIVSGEVRGFDRSDVLIDLGGLKRCCPIASACPPRNTNAASGFAATSSRSPAAGTARDHPFPQGSRLRAQAVQLGVSEINDGTIEVKGIAREPGFRTKLAVHSRDDKVDPVGACVGLRGQRVKNIVRELNNEKIDIIPWDDDIETYVTNALSPPRSNGWPWTRAGSVSTFLSSQINYHSPSGGADKTHASPASSPDGRSTSTPKRKSKSGLRNKSPKPSMHSPRSPVSRRPKPMPSCTPASSRWMP